MKKEISKIIGIILIFICLACSVIRQEQPVFKVEYSKLLSKEVEMHLPAPFHLQKENYEEGVIYYYSFIDSSYIIVFEGSMMEFPVDKYTPQKTEVLGIRRTSFGSENGRFWRKDVIEGIRIYYDNVPLNNKEMYNKVLDSIIIRSL